MAFSPSSSYRNTFPLSVKVLEYKLKDVYAKCTRRTHSTLLIHPLFSIQC